MKITIFVFNPKRHWTLTILKGASEPWTKIKVVVKRVTCGHQNKDKSWWHKRGEFDRCWHAVKCHDMTTSLNIHQLFSNTRIFTVLTYFLENNKQWLTYNSFFLPECGSQLARLSSIQHIIVMCVKSYMAHETNTDPSSENSIDLMTGVPVKHKDLTT